MGSGLIRSWMNQSGPNVGELPSVLRNLGVETNSSFEGSLEARRGQIDLFGAPSPKMTPGSRLPGIL